ncbi:unnamed protein product [Plutella xylostella]|uniref:(diamondback moth) hypothetical protein n=1 Tax=Plutella xylostella TaxID=51655 RepID=A0A8S4CZN5_PLUXY|nr:unnamed protein product [Plutella xylostella]CAG9099771.1 unnamed protein product [Plutella xylostella]
MVQTSEKKKELQQWETSHPASLQARVEPRNIDILLGCDIMFQILLRERLPVIPGQLFLHNTQFGYIVAGTAPLNSEGCSSLPSNFCNFPIFSGIPPLPPGHASIMRRSPG